MSSDPRAGQQGSLSSAFVIDAACQRVVIAGQPVALQATEFRILQFLASAPGRTFRRPEILDGINDQNYAVTDRAVDVHITHLRKKLGPFAIWIETVRGQGYRFRDALPPS